jgi:drug/metabolite transporter (DMT)-like permease
MTETATREPDAKGAGPKPSSFRPSSPLQGVLTALLAYGVFATHDVLIKEVGRSHSVIQILFFASLFAFLPVTLLLAADKALDNLRPKNLGLVVLRTAAMVVSMTLGFYAFTTLALAETYALLFSAPLLITALSVPMLGERVGVPRWIAVLVGLVGVLVVLRPGVSALGTGHIAALVAAFGSALAAIIARKIAGQERGAVLVLYPLLANVALMGLALPWVYRPMQFESLALTAAIGVIAPVAQLLMVAAYRAAPAALIAPFQYSQMLWAVPYGFFFFGETPDAWVALGGAIVIGSGIFILWRESRGRTSRLTPTLARRNTRPDSGPQLRP